MKEHSLYFWDVNLPASEAVHFGLDSYTREPQLGIWFIDTMDYWITADKHCVLSIWDIVEQERLEAIKIKAPTSECRVLDVAEIVHLRLLVVATSEKLMYIYSMDRRQLMGTFCLDNCGFNIMKYFESYQTLLVSGYENVVKVFTFTPGFSEINIAGRLVGHVGIIEGISVIHETAMVVTADDKGTAKVWDIRKLTCIQTVKLDNKAHINSAVHMTGLNRVVFVGDRLNSIEFEEDFNGKKKIGKVIPIGFDLVEDRQELYIATRSEIRVVDLSTGQVKSIFVNMIDKEQNDEITCFKFLHKRNQFVLGNFNGVISVFNASTSLQIKSNQPHSGSVSGLAFDEVNGMILTSSMDATVSLEVENTTLPVDQVDELDDAAEREEYFSKPMMDKRNAMSVISMNLSADKKEAEEHNQQSGRSQKHMNKKSILGPAAKDACQLRSITNCNANTEVSMLELSVYHNIVALANLSGKVYLYNYEYFKPAAMIEVEDGAEVTSLAFVSGYCKLIVASSTGAVHIFSVWFENLNQFAVTYDMCIPLHKNSYIGSERQSKILSGYANRLVLDMGIYHTEDMISTKSNFELVNGKDLMVIDSRLHLENAELILAESSGVICRYDIEEYLQHERAYKPYSVNPNYNQFRKISEDYTKCTAALEKFQYSVEKMHAKYDFSKFIGLHVKTFKAARELVSQLNLINFSQKLLLLTSEDSTFRVFTLAGQMMCHLNLNHPLPIIWNFSPDNLINLKSKLVFALKTVELISQRYNKPEHRSVISLRKILEAYTDHNFSTFSMTSIDETAGSKHLNDKIHAFGKRNNSINLLLDGQTPTNAQGKANKGNPQIKEGAPARRRQGFISEVTLMKDLYDPKDMVYEKIKAENREEIQGPTMKQLESIRRAKNIQKKSDPLYGDEMDPRLAAFAEREKINKEKKKVNKRYQMEYEDPIKAEIRRKKITKSMASKMSNIFEAIEDKIILEAATPRVPGPMISRSSRNFKQLIPKLGVNNTPKVRLSSRGQPLSSREQFEQSQSTAHGQLPPIDASIADEIHKVAPDFFEYASEKNVMYDDLTSHRDLFRSQVLHESSRLSQISNTLFSSERRQEKKHFQSILKGLDQQVIKSKASYRSSNKASLITQGYPLEGESTVISTRVHHPKEFHSISLPRLFK